MDNNNTILNMEANLLQNRIKSWYFNNVGREIVAFDKQRNQEDTIQLALRFTNSLFVALDLTGELFNFQATIKFLLVNTLRMIERRSKSTNDQGIDPTSFIAYIRKRFAASISLFRFLISPEYRGVKKEDLAKSNFLNQVGGDSLCTWGESLMSFAECSLKFWKAQYNFVLKTAEDRLSKCIKVSPNKHQAHYYLGTVLLLLARSEVVLSPPFLSLVHKAKDEFFEASQGLHGVKAYNFSFIRACALLGQEQELSQLLPSFVSTFPENAVAWLSETDFDQYRSHKWFQVLTTRVSNPNSSPNTYSFQPLPPQPSPAQPLPPPHPQPPQLSHSPPPPQQSIQKQPPKSPEKPLPPHLNPTHPLHNIANYELMNSYPPPNLAQPDIPYFVYPDPYAYQPMSTIPPPANTQSSPTRTPVQLQRPHTKTGMEEKQYGQLQSSLIESGFSIKRLLEVFSWLPVSSGILQIHPDEESDHVKKQKQRLNERLELYQLKPKREIPGDGNCQMHAVSDQLYDTIERSKEVRKIVVEWLRKNKNWKLPNESILHEFVHDKPWEEYCNVMEKDGCWGDHLTLLAISEIFGAVISIMSSVEGDNFITEIHPTNKKTNKVILLSHYAEFHYGSLTHIGATLK
jgi:hypothetical protein